MKNEKVKGMIAVLLVGIIAISVVMVVTMPTMAKEKVNKGAIFEDESSSAVSTTMGSLSQVPSPDDDFDDDSIDMRKWCIGISDPENGFVEEINQELRMTLTPGSSGDSFSVGLTSKWLVEGDFDIQVDYKLLNWPSENGIRVGLGASGGPVERVSFNKLYPDFPGEPREVYLTHFLDGVQGITSTTDMSGKLRLNRVGSTLTGYYFSKDSWIPIHSGPGTTDATSISLSIWGHQGTPGVIVVFDNFSVNSGQILWPSLPTVSISTDKYEYSSGDTMLLHLDVTNPGDAQAVGVKIGVEKPDGSTVWFINKPSVTLPAGLEYSKDKLITLPSIPAGIYTWRAILDDPVTGEIICEDTAEWEFVGGEGLTDLTEILKEITIVEDFGECAWDAVW